MKIGDLVLIIANNKYSRHEGKVGRITNFNFGDFVQTDVCKVEPRCWFSIKQVKPINIPNDQIEDYREIYSRLNDN